MAKSSRKLSSRLWSPLTIWGVLVILVIGGIAGMAALFAAHAAIVSTENTEFCISCHEMRDTVYAEYTETVHYSNASGVQAGCPDCHVPKPFIPMVIDYYEAIGELYYSYMGTIDTPEKFEAHRLEMAQSVWDDMVASDSRECRACHSQEHMDFSLQDPDAAKQMQAGFEKGETCIDCHKGIAHKLPDMTTGYKSIWTDLLAASATLKPTPGNTYYTLATTEFTAQEPGEGVARAGRVLPQTPLVVLETSGDNVKVTFTGWRQEGADRAVYAFAGKRIFVAALDPAGIELVKNGDSITDADTAQVWTEVSLDVWLPASSMTDNLEKLTQYGSELFLATCAACHAAPHFDAYVANQWIGVMNTMKTEVTMDPENYQFVQKYLQLHSPDALAVE